MKLTKTFLPFVLTLTIIFSCKKKEEDTTAPANPPEEISEKLATILTIQNQATYIYSDTLLFTHDPEDALNAMGQWLLDQPEVDKVYAWSFELVEVFFKNGLQSTISFAQLDAADKPLTRGGSSGGGKLKRLSFSSSGSPEKIKNNKVLVLNPFIDEFYNSNYNKRPLFDGGPETMDVTIINGDNVQFSDLSTLGDYGFIILNTHGLPQGFILQKLIDVPASDSDKVWTRENVLDALAPFNIPIQKFDNGEIKLNLYSTLKNFRVKDRHVDFLITDKFIRSASLNLDKSVVFGNHCYSGFTAVGVSTYNMAAAWESKGVISYYGYGFEDGTSEIVKNSFASRVEDSLIINLVHEGDTTGVAHLAGNTTIQEDDSTRKQFDFIPVLLTRATRFTPSPPSLTIHLKFKHFFEDNYSYSRCGDTITDLRDGQKYPTVCIGDQVWMAQNLNWSGAGVCYDNDPVNCNMYGRLYSINELTNLNTSNTNPSGVRGLCPQGWHVPSVAEWNELFNYADSALVSSADKLCNQNDWPLPNLNTDQYGLSLQPGGLYNAGGPGISGFHLKGNYGLFWTSTKSTTGAEFYNAAVIISQPNNHLSFTAEGEGQNPDFSLAGTNYCSCRCVKD